jgi:signal transduction histidine kinase
MRRKIERNLHDGSQQRLVTLSLELQDIQASYDGSPELRGKLEHMAEGMASLQDELREISRGLHPAILSRAGLRLALKSLARRAPMPVELVVDVTGRVAEPIEVAAYYLVSEALTNVAKHSGASVAEITVAVSDDVLHVRVRDDGVGGADAAGGSGLIGLRDRVEALGGIMAVDSPPRRGTSIVAEIPLTVTSTHSPLRPTLLAARHRVRVALWTRQVPVSPTDAHHSGSTT